MAPLNPEAPEFIPSQLQHQHQLHDSSMISWSGFPPPPPPSHALFFSPHRLHFLPFPPPPKFLLPRFLFPFPSTHPTFFNNNNNNIHESTAATTKLINAPYLEDIEPSIIAEATKNHHHHQLVLVEETKEGNNNNNNNNNNNVKRNYGGRVMINHRRHGHRRYPTSHHHHHGWLLRKKKEKVAVQYHHHHHHHHHHDHHKYLRHKNKRFFDKSSRRAFYSNNSVSSSSTTITVDGDETTVMIKNIPNKYTRDMLVEYLEKECMMENNEGSGIDDSVLLAFDFVYLPIDFESGMNKGYAFVNFTSPKGACKFKKTASQAKWDLFQSHKIREVVAARLQGIEALERHFGTMNFPWDSEEVLPLFFNPPRDGVFKGPQRTVGRLLFKP